MNKSLFFYLATVLSWGTTWVMIPYQVGVVPSAYSIAYRFFLAGLIFGVIGFFKKMPMAFSPKQHIWLALEGLFLFCSNYLAIYIASVYANSGLISVAFASIVVWNILNSAIFMGEIVTARVVMGALTGLAGITLVFWPEITAHGHFESAALAVGWTVLGAYSASLGNMVAMRNMRSGMGLIPSNAYAMVYGATTMLMVGLLGGQPMIFEWSFSYVTSLLYLVAVGSLISFYCYISLLNLIGATKAAYSTVVFPVIALTISTFVEDYTWTPVAFAGLTLVLAGNILIVSRPKTVLAPAKENTYTHRT